MPTSEFPFYRRSLPYWQKARRANFLLWPTSDYQAGSPWTETGGNHLVRDILLHVSDAKTYERLKRNNNQ